MEVLRNVLAGFLILGGSMFVLTAAIGLIRLPDLYTRMHAASKAGTLGSCVLLLALAVVSDELSIVTRVLGGVTFFLLTAPVSAHLLAKAAHAAGIGLWSSSRMDDYERDHSAGEFHRGGDTPR